MSDLAGLLEAAALRSELGAVSRQMAAIMADPQTRAQEHRPSTMGRRMAKVTAVNAGPPLTADVDLDGTPIPGASPQSTYRPQVDDLVWLEFLGSDPHISPPLTTDANRKWNLLSAINGWAAKLDGGWTVPPGWWRDAHGVVHLRGSVKSGNSNTVPANLPAGARPPGLSGHPVYCFDSNSIVAAAVVSIGTDGNITYYGPPFPVQVALDGITFRVD